MGVEAVSTHAPVGPETGKAPPKPTIITPHAIRNLHGFIDAVGWKLIYGLNMGTRSLQIAAEEAAYVFNTLGPNPLSITSRMSAVRCLLSTVERRRHQDRPVQ
jgi:hypothetical protein